MKSGKKIKLKSSNENFKIIVGAIDNYKAPFSVFISLTSWVSAKKNIKNLDLIKKQLRLKISDYLKSSELFRDHFTYDSIINIEISPTRINLNKPTFFNLELNLYQKGYFLPLVSPKNANYLNLKPILENIINDILLFENFTNDEYFEFSLTKNNKRKYAIES